MTTSFGSLIDNMGVVAELRDGQQISDVMVLAKVIDCDTGETALGIYSSPTTDWITRTGLVHAARQVLEADPPESDDD